MIPFIVIPLTDGINLEDIPDDVKEAAKLSVKMWEDYIENENKNRIEELKKQVNMLKTEMLDIDNRTTFFSSVERPSAKNSRKTSQDFWKSTGSPGHYDL